ncbi:MAG: hypothetical protein Q8K71_16085 [Polaromonas sp.]|uniref:hypothetical protein n=1 Tax=Polaromonas sp. TaxID=1869339 RepID=UPI002731E6A4|nr:hypothetical protein [Polaromonas sp.]MDP1740604.1 hypothetical protein [Polaromonas sp.]MDP1955991.1 hypothetical protein [Polaromonas sp.]MDP3752026.1 hypothetical protein [Polaromonas sp.]
MQFEFSGPGGGMAAGPGGTARDVAQSQEVTRLQQQCAPIAQLLLVARLRARNRRDLARDSLERAAHVMFVTCKNWWLLGRDAAAKKPAATKTEENSLHPIATIPTESPDAHRHD